MLSLAPQTVCGVDADLQAIEDHREHNEHRGSMQLSKRAFRGQCQCEGTSKGMMGCADLADANERPYWQTKMCEGARAVGESNEVEPFEPCLAQALE